MKRIYLFFVLFLVFSSLYGEEKGWFPVEKPVLSHSEGEESEADLWVVFVKKIGTETIFVRFPEEPIYRLFPSGACEFSAAGKETKHHLRIEKNLPVKQGRYQELLLISDVEALVQHPETGDLSYLCQGKWICEHVVESGEFRYLFQTVADHLSDEAHQKFIGSFQFLKSESPSK